jgi:diguanylate cyclase (GGDEF)-like protein
VARLGGDEFTIILENLSSPATAQGVVDKITAAMRRSYAMGDGDAHAPVSIGIAYFGGNGCDADGLLKRADMALYQAKARGRDGHCVYEPEAA